MGMNLSNALIYVKSKIIPCLTSYYYDILLIIFDSFDSFY